MKVLFLFCLALSLARNLNAIIFFSDLTPSFLIEDFIGVVQTFEASIIIYHISESVLKFVENNPTDVIFDFTYSMTHGITLQMTASNLKVPYFTPENPANSKLHKHIFYLHQDPKSEAEAIKILLKELRIPDFFLISDSSREETASLIGEYQTIPSLSPQRTYDEYTLRSIKTSGNWRIVVLSDAEGSQKTFQSTQNAKIYGEYMAFITVGRGALSEYKKGIIEVIEEGLKEARTQGEYEGLAVIKALSILNTLSPANRVQLLEEAFQTHITAGNYSVMNYKTDHFKEEIGKISEFQIQMTSSVVYPGDASPSNSTKPVLRISANLGLFDYDGNFNPTHALMTSGLPLMVSLINADDSLLKNYQLELFGSDCGPQYVNYDYLRNCFRKYIPELKGVYIDGVFDEMVAANMEIMEEYGVKIPHVATFIENGEYFNKEKYPNLLITTPPFQYVYTILPYILKSFGWENIIFFYSEIGENYQIFIQNCEILGIRILNSHRAIPGLIDLSNPEKYFHYFDEILNSKCRIVVSMQGIPNNEYLAHLLYEYGYRRGDLVLITSTRTSDTIDLSYLGFDKNKVIEILDGSISLFYLEFVEEYGQYLRKQLEEYLFPSSPAFSCYMIDSMLLAVHTMQMLIDLELDYEDPGLVRKFIRKQKFTGCAGRVTIDSSGNGMGEIKFGIFNFVSQGEGNWTEEYLGSYTLGTLVPLQLNREITWPNGSTEIPEDMIREIPCENSSDTDSSTLMIQWAALGIGILLSVFFLWAFYRVSVTEIENTRDMMFEDGVFLALPLVEALQHSMMNNEFNPVIIHFGSIAIFDWSYFVRFEEEVFLRFFVMVLTLVCLWVILICLCLTCVFARLHKKIQDCLFFAVYICFPFIAQYGFIPFILTLLKIFECSGTFAYDCSVQCWESYHLFLSILSFSALILYIMMAILLKVETDYYLIAVNIKTNPVFYCLKTIYQLILIGLCVSKFENHQAYYLISIVIWLGVITKMKPYNYPRFNFWQKMIVAGEMVNAGLQLIQEYSFLQLNIIVSIQVFCFCSIALFGFLVQRKRYPSFLYRQPGSDIHKLIKFAFGRVSAKELTMRSFTYVHENPVVLQRRLEIIS